MTISFASRVLFATYFIEAGLVLIVTPWMPSYWDRNFFVEHLPALESIVQNVFVRGAVSGVGAVTALVGFAELRGIFGVWRRKNRIPKPES